LADELRLFTCSNAECQRSFEKPILLTNLSKASAEQHYVCPHCFTKIEFIPDYLQRYERKKEELLVEISEKREKGYSKCGGYLGYLSRLPENASIPQECLTCPKNLECAMKKSDF